jgi:hypothetical protein
LAEEELSLPKYNILFVLVMPPKESDVAHCIFDHLNFLLMYERKVESELAEVPLRWRSLYVGLLRRAPRHMIYEDNLASFVQFCRNTLAHANGYLPHDGKRYAFGRVREIVFDCLAAPWDGDLIIMIVDLIRGAKVTQHVRALLVPELKVVMELWAWRLMPANIPSHTEFITWVRPDSFKLVVRHNELTARQSVFWSRTH